MTSSVQNIISELELLFVERFAATNSVKTNDGHVVALDRTLWELSPVLRKRSIESNACMQLSVPQRSVLALLDLHRNGVLPRELATLYDLLALTSHLELAELKSECLSALCRRNALDKQDLPLTCSTDTVLECFKVLLDCPLRTADIYKQQLERIAKHCGNNADIMTNAFNLLREKLESFADMGFEGIPLDFNRRDVSVVVYKEGEKIETAVYTGEKLIPVKLFGRHFDTSILEKVKVYGFKYGWYVLYEFGGSMFRKDLRSQSDPVEVLNGCTLVLARQGFVFAVRPNKDHTTIWLWVDDKKFVPVGKTRYRLEAIDFNLESRILAVVRRSNAVKFYRLENNLLRTLDKEKLRLLKYCDELLKSQKFRALRKHITINRRVKLHWLLMAYRMLESDESMRSKLLEGAIDSKKSWKQKISHLFKCDSCEFVKTLNAAGKAYKHMSWLTSSKGALHVVAVLPSIQIQQTILKEGLCHLPFSLPLTS